MEKQKSSAFQLSGEAVEELNCVVCLENKTLLLLPCQHRCCKECTGNKDQCEICNKNEVEMKCQQCKKFICCRCSLNGKCESCEGSRHDVEDIEDLVTAADSKLEAWVQATEQELTLMEEKLKQLHQLQQDYQKKKTLLSSVRTVLVSDISVIDRLGIINQIATGMGTTTVVDFTGGSQALPQLQDGSSASKDQFYVRNIVKTSVVAYSFNDKHRSDQLWIILDVKDVGIVVGTRMSNIVTFLLNMDAAEKPYVIDEENKLPLTGWYGTPAMAASNGTLLLMGEYGKVWENVLPNQQTKPIASLCIHRNVAACAQTDREHVYVGDCTQKLIIKYKLKDGKAVLVLQHPDVTHPYLLLGDAKQNRLFAFNSPDQRIHMFENDEHQWATQLVVYCVKFTVREEDGKVFFIGRHGEEKPYKHKLVIVDPAIGSVLCDRDITDLYRSIVPCPDNNRLQDFAVIENTLWFVTSNEVTQVMLM